MHGQRPALFALPLAIWERDGLKAVLARAGLPVDDVGHDGPLFWRFERDDVPVGFAGIEVHGQDAVLRSLITLPPLRRQGIGGAMIDKMEVEARARGASAIYLLTRDFVTFFAKLGAAALIAAMHAHPILIERPVVRTSKGTRLCRPPERVLEIL